MELLSPEKTIAEVRKAARIGVLVLGGVRVNVGSKMQSFKRGDVIKPTESQLGNDKDEEMTEFLITISNKLGDSTSNFAIFKTKAQFDAAVLKIGQEVQAEKDRSAKQLVDAAVDRYLSQGRKPSVPSFRRLLDETLVTFDKKIRNQHLINLCQDFDLKK